jgi:hypothetical protein
MGLREDRGRALKDKTRAADWEAKNRSGQAIRLRRRTVACPNAYMRLRADRGRRRAGLSFAVVLSSFLM